LRPSESCARDEVVADAMYIEPMHGAKTRFDVVGDRAFMVTDRRDVDECRGGRQ
jgi:hypothetical protein